MLDGDRARRRGSRPELGEARLRRARADWAATAAAAADAPNRRNRPAFLCMLDRMTPPSLSDREHPPMFRSADPMSGLRPEVKEMKHVQGLDPGSGDVHFATKRLTRRAYRDFVAWQIAEGSHGLVPCGTTGEGADARFGRASPRSIEVCVEVGGRPGAGHRRLRLERHPPRDRADPRRQGGRRRRRARTSRLITTGPTRRASTPISPRSPRRSTCRSCSTTCPRARSPTSRSRRWRGWRKIANVVAVKDATGNLARVSAQRARLRRGFHPALGQ